MDSEHPTQPSASDGTVASLLARLYKIDAVLAHFLEIILSLQETQPDLAYCLEYLLFANEGQRKTAQAWFRLIDSAKKRERVAASEQPDMQGP
jgi:hypothetical protein